MSTLRKLKIKKQRELGDFAIPETQKPQTANLLLGNPKTEGQNLKIDEGKNLGVTFNANEKLTDGYWIILHNWSQCNLKCGGGVSLLQRMCVPPKNGGSPCVGEAILSKPCNNQPCPKIYETKNFARTNTTQTLSPTVKILPFSTRPQRYSKCLLKEADLMLSTDISNERRADGVEKIQIPVRVVMNNKTLAAFAGVEYNEQKISFTLSKTAINPSGEHANCFILRENEKTAEFCPFGFDKSISVFEEWDYDFNLFKYQCHTKRDIIHINSTELQNRIVYFIL